MKRKAEETERFIKDRQRLSFEENEALDQEVDKLCKDPTIGQKRNFIGQNMYSYIYSDRQGSKFIGYEDLGKSIRFHIVKIRSMHI